MADADSSPIASISPSSGAGDADAAAAIEKQLAGLGLAVDGGGGFPEPSGWEVVPVPVAVSGGGGFPEPSGWEVVPVPVAVSGGGDEVAGEKLHPPPTVAGADARVRYPRRPGEPDCTYYLKFGNCRFGVKCKFNHPARKKSRVKGSGSSGSNSSSNKASSPDDDQAPREEYEGLVPDISYSLGFDDKGTASRKTSCEVVDMKKGRMVPKIAEGPEKGIYFKKLDETNVRNQKGAKDKRREAVSEGSAQEECKYYSTPGGCKFGKACKYLHHEGKEEKTEVEKVDLNFLGLPLRPGEKECPYYMRTGSCKYATNCKFHHPDPTNVTSKEPVLEHENGETPQQNVQGPSQTRVPIWPDQRALNEQHVPFLAPAQSYSAGMIPPQGMYPSPDWSGYHQVPLNPYYPPGVPFQHFPAHMNHPMYKAADVPGHQQVSTDEYPERPGQPECQHFVRSGFCKYKMKCRYHHPRSRLPAPLTGLSPLGLPIKPDQPVCTYYGRFGVCKYGPACMFNHPFNFGPSVLAAGPPLPGQYPTPGNFTV
ncbi:zinc finger CCCH domain-containing protein 65-like isoform X2 [Phragmites australis]|uniref:zinc finger CCCH domain-containing protein 65-like isoform X2 n=1 Tax=Phragmites australis TaxID=29695 RepID=UPI002D783BB2|nr:zinc finger CCCH domain-containing protein 65-like isoform X2 [Phragmites australis]